MQKVITVTTHTNILKAGQDYTEVEYENLKKYLEDGYKVNQVIPFATSASDSFRFTLTFILEKVNQQADQ